MRRHSRSVLTLVAVALVASACTSGENIEVTTTTSAPEESTTSLSEIQDEKPPEAVGTPVTIEDVLGGTQSVQDFAIFVSMWKHGGDSPGGFYEEVIDVARSEFDLRGVLGGGMRLDSTGAISGLVVDEADNPISSLRADYATIAMPTDGVLAVVEPLGIDELEGRQPYQGAEEVHLLLEVITADYEVARTHAGPGDRVMMDLSGIESIRPGDVVAMSYLFGQTYPGDPEIEEGLDPLDLFRYRWNQGLFAILENPATGDASPTADPFVEIVGGQSVLEASSPAGRTDLQRFVAASGESAGAGLRLVATAAESDDGVNDEQGSGDPQSEGDESSEDGSGNDASDDGPTMSRRAIKQQILLETRAEARQAWDEFATSLDEDHDPDYLPNDGGVSSTLPGGRILYTDYATNEAIVISDLANYPASCGPLTTPCPSIPGEYIESEGTYEDFTNWVGLDIVFAECTRVAEKLNIANQAQFVTSEVGPFAEDSGVRLEGNGIVRGFPRSGEEVPPLPASDEDPLAPRPGPVGCGGDFPGGPPDLPTGIVWGDVHATTIDGNYYANQAVGEFLMYDDGTAEIQMRTEPWQGRSDISVATAFAVRIDEHTVSMHVDGTTWIDGEVAQIERGVTRKVGGGDVLWWDQGWVVVWPNGTVLRAHISEVSQLGQVTPANGLAVGLLGNFDGNPDNDFFTRDGETLASDINYDFEAFYDRYVDSWRITDEESAFHYEEGESTATFTDLSFPSQAADLAKLPADARQAAEEICATTGATKDRFYEACVLDVGATGESWFAYQAAFARETTPEPAVPAPVPGGPAGNGENTLTFGNTTILFGPNPPVLDSTAPVPSWTCEVDRGVLTAISTFTESPTVNWDLNIQYVSPENEFGGDESFRVLVSLNGVPYAWMQTISEDFVDAVASLTFEGESLEAEGELYVNDPATDNLGFGSPLPAGAELTPFTVRASCG